MQPLPTHTLPIKYTYSLFYATLYTGSKSQPLSVLVDTGSNVLAFFSNLCTANCLPSQAFNTSASTTFKKVTCGTYASMKLPNATLNSCKKQCVGRSSSYACVDSVTYGTASLPSGIWYYNSYDQVGFEASLTGRQFSSFGAIYNQSNFDTGIWGTGYLPVDDLLLTYSAVEKNSIKVFSLCTLGSTATSYMYIGGIKRSIHTTKSATISVNPNYLAWWLINPGQIAISFNGSVILNKTGSLSYKIILDSGTNFHILPTAVLKGIHSVLEARCNQLNSICKVGYTNSASSFIYYYNITDMTKFLYNFSSITLTLGNGTFACPISNFLLRGSTYLYYLGIASTEQNGMPISIIGSPLMVGYDVVFDRLNSVISVFPVLKCYAANRLLQEEEEEPEDLGIS